MSEYTHLKEVNGRSGRVVRESKERKSRKKTQNTKRKSGSKKIPQNAKTDD